MPYYLMLGPTEIPVQYGGGGRKEPARSGELAPTWYNNVFTSEDATETREEWRFTTPPLPGAEWDVIRPVLESGELFDASGYAISRAEVPVDPLDPTGPQQPATVQVRPRLTGVVHHREGTTDIRYEATFELQAV